MTAETRPRTTRAHKQVDIATEEKQNDSIFKQAKIDFKKSSKCRP